MTNDQFEDRVDAMGLNDSDDKVLRVVQEEAWYLYDDWVTHRLREEHAVTQEAKREIARWIVFLHSNYPYEWPANGCMSALGWVFALLTFGTGPRLYRRLMRRRIEAMGDWAVWPFIRKSDFHHACAFPRLLTGYPDRSANR